MNRLGWLEHVLHIHLVRLPRCTLLHESGKGWKMVQGCQSVTWGKCRKLTNGLAGIDASKLPDWDLRDPSSDGWG